MKRDYGRTTITVPWDLKARMKKARAQVNWSAVACDAFEQKLEELGPIEDITSLEDTVQRMKATGEACSPSNPEASESGLQAGKHWAMNFARQGQLQRIEELRDKNIAKDSWESLMNSGEGWKHLTECLAPRLKRTKGQHRNGPGEREDDDSFEDIEARPGRHRNRKRCRPMGPGGGRGRHPYREVWRSILNERPDHPGFFLGFATGALEVWDQIKDQF